MNELAESVHSDNLKIALEQFNKAGNVLPRLSAASDGKIYEFSIVGMKLETALEILKVKIKPIEVNLTALSAVRTQPPVNEMELVDPLRCLFVMTLDCFGGRLVSLLKMRKEGGTITTESVDFDHESSDLILHTNGNNELELRLEQESVNQRQLTREGKRIGSAA